MKKGPFASTLALCLAITFTALPGSAAPAPQNEGDPGRPSGSLTTFFAYDDGWAGNMFDIIPAFDMQITGIDVNTKAFGTTATADLWYRQGTSVGYENSGVGWTYMGTYSGIGAGHDKPTFIDVSGNGAVFQAGVTYGIYVDLTSYAATGTFLFTAGKPSTYKNSDLTLITHCGKGPGFGGTTIPDREWNGTVYYDNAGPDIPRVDIKCNGGDSAVTVPAGANARIDYSVTAGIGAGIPIDIWIVMNTPFGFFCYDGIGPFSGWNMGYGMAFYTGPLADMNGTALDRPLPAGPWKAYIGIDSVPNGTLNLTSIYTADSVDFTVN